jgi:segregation and condensation protein A
MKKPTGGKPPIGFEQGSENSSAALMTQPGPSENPSAALAAEPGPSEHPSAALAAEPGPSEHPSAALAADGFSLDLDVFEGPFDLLITLILNEDVDLLEVSLADVVLAYIERLEARGELDLEAATEFLILIAALLELKSRLMLPGEEMPELDIEPQEAVEELLARLLEYRRFRLVAETLRERLEDEQGYRYRSAPPPPALRTVALESATKAYDPVLLGEAIRALLRTPPAVDTSHLTRITVSFERRLQHLRELLASRRKFTFDEAVGNTDRITQAVTLFALLELYKSGELVWRQDETFGPIEISGVEAT